MSLSTNELQAIRDLCDKAIKGWHFDNIKQVRSALHLRDRVQEEIAVLAAQYREARNEFHDFKNSSNKQELEEK